MRIPTTIQMYTGENGIAIISSMLGAYGKYVPLESLREKMVVSRNGSTPQQLADTAKQFGLSTEILNVPKENLVHQSFPLIAFWKRKYYCIIKKIVGDTVYVMDPAKGNVKLPLDFFMDKYGGILIRIMLDIAASNSVTTGMSNLIRNDRLIRLINETENNYISMIIIMDAVP